MDSPRAPFTPQEAAAARAVWKEFLEDIDQELALSPPNIRRGAPHWLIQQSGDLMKDYFTNPNINALEGCVACGKRAIELVVAGDPDEATILNNCGLALVFRFSKLRPDGSIDDLNEAIALYRRAVALNTDQKRKFTNNLVRALSTRFDISNSISDLDELIEIQTESLATIAPNSPKVDDIRLQLTIHLYTRYEETGVESYLQKALRLIKEAGVHVPSRLARYDPTRQGDWLHTAAVCHGLEFELKGHPDLMNKAIVALELAIQKTPLDAPQRSVSMNSLGILLSQKFEITHAIDVLDEAIKWTTEASADQKPTAQLRALTLHTLASMYLHRYARLFDVESLVQSIEVERKAIDTTTSSNDQRLFQSTLANSLTHLSTERDDPEILQEAIDIARGVTDDLPEDYGETPKMCMVLAQALLKRYKKLKAEEDLNDFVQTVQTALRHCPDEAPQRCTILWELGRGLNLQGGENLEASLAAYEAAAKERNGKPLHRLLSALDCAKRLIQSSSWNRIDKIMDVAIELLPKVSPKSLSRDDQQFILGYLSGIATISCSSALKAGRSAYDALVRMESCRGVIAGTIIDSRSDVDALRQENPALYEEYTSLRKLIAGHHSGALPLPQSNGQLTLDRYIERLGALEEQIRSMDAFSRFQLPPLPETIQSLASSGPVVAFNVSDISSDAIVITQDGITSINLPHLTLPELEANLAKLSGKGNLKRRHASLIQSNVDEEDECEEMLVWLWDVAVKPVLEHLKLLNYDRPPTSKLPCIWWVSNGLMGLAPIHAAGTHTEGSKENTLSHVVSSYSSTLKALEFCRRQPWMSLKDRKVLVVAMPNTPGYAELNLEQETAAIQAIFGSTESLVLECPSRQNVIDELRGRTITHFACHGFCHPNRPDESGLLLGREAVEQLTVRDLAKIDYGVSQIAYLSACSTAEISPGKLVDESIHLANSFQLIGYRHVVATLWGAYDEAAVEVARNFYSTLSTAGGDEGLTVAYALHEATLAVREYDRHDIMSWAPFVHYGA
ncbi:hypothetical protein DRE_06464 [Drechslerella stenobrocha 248]|uniref:CHAT domain-containing protein n=1 Tax=Drechslerella stenobrocha 248 TaxID=1043628 RepID=W7HLE3_9PEZI|nr:hypothetical protein DRE_06464 [Drechslerella stenobrocha 248]